MVDLTAARLRSAAYPHAERLPHARHSRALGHAADARHCLVSMDVETDAGGQWTDGDGCAGAVYAAETASGDLWVVAWDGGEERVAS